MENKNYYNDLFITLCEKNDLYKIKIILQLNEEIKPDINYNNNEAVIISCIHDYYDLFKFLIEHPETNLFNKGRLFTTCCDYGSLNCAKYLLEKDLVSPEEFKNSLYYLLIDITDNEKKESVLEYFLHSSVLAKHGNFKQYIEKSFPEVDVRKVFAKLESRHLENTLEIKNEDKVKILKI